MYSAGGVIAARWRAPKARVRRQLRALLVGTDLTVLAAAHGAAGIGRLGDPFAGDALRLAAVLIPLYAAAALAGDAYATAIMLSPSASARRAIKALVLVLGTIMALMFLSKTGAAMSRVLFVAVAALAASGLATTRWWISRNAIRWLGGDPHDVVLINDGVAIPTAAGVSVFAGSDPIDPGQPDPGTFDRLGRLADAADRVVVACPPERRALWAAALQATNVQGEIVAPELEGFAPLGIARHARLPTLIVARAPLSLRDRATKRGFDLVLTAILLFAVGPLMLGLALAVCWDSPGPALFRQPRLGRRSRPFTILKFRTMRVEAGDVTGHRAATRDDERVTPLGRWLRRTSLDELPQLLNVLKGEMSLVGPRPHALGSRAGDRLFWEHDARYFDRHAIRPGLTGLAQVRGLRGATNAGDDLTQRLHADREYRDGWSLRRDIAILLRTIPALIGRNAF